MPIEDFKGIVESLKLAVAIADAKGRVVFGNGALAQLLGCDTARIAGKPLCELFAAGDQKRVQQNAARIAQGKTGVSRLDAQLVDTAPPQWVQVALQPALDRSGRAAGVIAVLQDIGAQREAEEALNLASARLIALAEALPVGAMIETGRGDVELVNAALCRALGLESAPQSLSGLPVDEVLARSPRLEAAALSSLCRHVEDATRLALDARAGGETSLERQPLAVEGEPAGAVWVARTQPALDRAAEVAAIEGVGEALSVALEGLDAIATRVQRMDLEPAILAQFESIRGATRNAMGAIGDLIDFSRVSGAVVLNKARFALRAAIAETVGRVIPAAEAQGCRLRVKVEQDVSDALEGDVARLQLVLRNLLDSAFALRPGAEITLQVTPEYATESGLELSFAVLAGGEAAARREPGASQSGMGVAMARLMVAAMGGELAIAERAQDALYGFSIRFPVLAAAPARRRPTYVSLVGLTVLVVSADAAQRLALVKLLRGWRMLPLEADNAPMALALLERLEQEASPVPLVIVANALPVQDGFLLALRIRQHPRLCDTLVMMLASEGRPGDAIACRENGIAAYMRYPVNDRQLNEAIVALTGASVDADETPTLVTRHSLREQRKGATVLLVDPHRDSQILAAHILGREDCSVVVANDLAEAVSALDQDLYDLVLVDTSLAGLQGDDAACVLRGRIARNPEVVHLVATSFDHSPAFHAAKTAIGFDKTVAKPLRATELLALLQALGRWAAAAP